MYNRTMYNVVQGLEVVPVIHFTVSIDVSYDGVLLQNRLRNM